MNRVAAGIPDYAGCFVSLPPFAAGVLSPLGLVREMSNPAGYSPAGGVYSRFPGYGRDGSFAGSSPIGSILTLSGDRWRFQVPFLISPYTGTGVTGVFSLPAGVSFSGAALRVRTPEEEVDTSWFSETLPVAAQDVLFSGLSIYLPFTSGSVSLAGGMSLPEYLPSGGFARGLLHWNTDLCSLSALLSCCSPRYLGLKGTYPKDLVTYALSLSLLPNSPVWFDIDLQRTIKRPPLMPEILRETLEIQGGGIGMSLGEAVCTARLARKVSWNDDGSGHVIRTLYLDTEYDTAAYHGSCELRFRKYDLMDNEIRGRVEVEMEFGVFKGGLVLSHVIGSGLDGKLYCSLNLPLLRMEVSAEPDGTLQCGLGVYQR